MIKKNKNIPSSPAPAEFFVCGMMGRLLGKQMELK